MIRHYCDIHEKRTLLKVGSLELYAENKELAEQKFNSLIDSNKYCIANVLDYKTMVAKANNPIIELIKESYNEAIEYAIKNDDGYGLAFLEHWSEGNWCVINDEWPEFNLNSEAQQHLIKESGGMPNEHK